MALRSPRQLRGGLAFHRCVGVAMGIWVGCTTPDGESLFRPLPPQALAGASGSGGATSGLAGSGGVGAAGEGSGGLSVSGGSGTGGTEAGGGGGGGTSDGPDASVGGSQSDAGVNEDAGGASSECVALGAEVCDGLDNDCDGVTDQGDTCAETCRGFALAGHAYMFCAEPVDRGVALARCEAQGMKLTWVETPEENAELVRGVAALGLENPADAELLTQIGASDSSDETEWIWVGNGVALDGFQFWEGDSADDGGEAVGGAYQNWATSEPNDDTGGEDCGVLSVFGSENRAAGQWDDRDCNIELPFLCEVP
jgi:lectin-like protein